MSAADKSPVSFPVHVARLPKKGMPVVIEADEKQRETLADAHGLNSVAFFRAELLVKEWKGDGVKVTGTVEAQIEQACVVTLEPLQATVLEEVDAVFVPEDSRLAVGAWAVEGEIHLSAEGPDAPETFVGDEIDVGALAEEFFGLGIDPYPRKTGAVVEEAAEQGGTEQESPFAKLRALRPKS